jgi:hypothetical protein
MAREPQAGPKRLIDWMLLFPYNWNMRKKYAKVLRVIEVLIGPSIAYVPLTQGQYALIDSEDAPRLNQWNWHALWSDGVGGFYAWRKGRAGEPKSNICMHRILAGDVAETHVDHANHRTLDNRKCNLRLATNSQNQANGSLRKNNTSGYKGVSRFRDKWKAMIMVNRQARYIGVYGTPQEASAAYEAKAKELFGEFAAF